MDQPACTIGVDMGTTDMKAVAFDRDNRVIARAQEQLPLWRDDLGAAEQDPALVADAATRVLATVVRQARAQGYAVARVGMSAAMHSLLPVAADGTPLMRALTWMDSRASDDARALWASPQGQALYARTGTPIHAMAPLPKLLWLRRAQPALFSAAARFISLKEYVWHRWLGAEEIDASLASATGLYNLRERAWDREALALTALTPDRLSTLVPTTTIRRGLRERALLDAGLAEQTPFVIGASDGVLANLGVGAAPGADLVVTIGTSCAVRVGAAQPITDPATRSFCYVLAQDRFIAGGPSNSGGIVLDWLIHDLLGAQMHPTAAEAGAERDFARLLTEAASAPDEHLLVLPYLAGERAPLWDASASAAIIGLRLNHTAAHVLRAAVEGILLNAYWIASGLVASVGRPQRILASGKVLEAEWIRQLASDIFGLPVIYRGAVDASASGAALLAEIATGARTWDTATGHHSAIAERTLTPAANAPYAGKFARFQQLAIALMLPQ